MSTDKESACQYKGCRRRVARDEMCIFHLPDKDPSEAEEFKAHLLGEIERMQKDATIPIINLSGFRFPKPGYKFSKIRFEKRVNFYEAIFEGEAHFYECEFSDVASFEEVKFLDPSSFDRVKFSSPAIFIRAKFRSVMGFSNTIFKGHAIFHQTRFKRDTVFNNTIFTGIAFFNQSQFLSDSTFYKCKFLGMAVFDRSKVASLISFVSTIFQTKDDQILSSPIDQFTRFEGVNVVNRGEIRFEGGVCMSRVSLNHADIQGFSFLDVKWGRLRGRASIMEHAIVEQRKLGRKDSRVFDSIPEVTPEHVHQIYVRLRRNLERSAGRYPEAGDFFINEKEMRKLILQEGREWPPLDNLPEWLILKLYGWLALYGESIMRPVLWTVIAILAFTALKIVFFRLQMTDAKPYLDFLMESVMAFFQMRSEPGLDILERLISIPILGSLFIALKRKFERR